MLVRLCLFFWITMPVLVALDAVDAGFAPVIRGSGSLRGMAWHAASSKMYAGVSGDKFAGQPITGSLLRFDIAGSLDTTYSPLVVGTVSKVITQPDGKLLIAGTFTSVSGHPTVNLARLLANGDVDTSFAVSGATLPSDLRTLAATADGAVYVGVGANVTAKYTYVNGAYKYVLEWPKLLYKFSSSGVADVAFSPVFSIAGAVASGSARFAISIDCLMLTGTGDIIAGGTFTMVNGTGRTCLAKLSPAGILDSAYAPEVANTSSFPPYSSEGASVYSLADAGGDRLYVGGAFTSVGGVSRKYVARLDSLGAVDPAFNPPISISLGGSSNVVTDLAVDSSGRVLVAGSFYFVFSGESSPRRNMVRLDGSGVPTEGVFDSSSTADIQALPGGGYWVSKSGTSWSGGELQFPVSRFLDNGTKDSSFSFDLRRRKPSLNSLQPVSVVPGRGVLVTNMWMREAGGLETGSLALLLPSGQVDPSFQPSVVPSTGVKTSLVLPDGRILIGGYFSTVGGLPRPNLALLEPDGSPVPGFDLGSGPSGTVDFLRLMPTGRILVGGTFTSINGELAKDVALLDLTALNATGNLVIEEILEARYGTETAYFNVLAIVKEALVGGAVILPINADTMGGDPAPGQTKRLTVRFRSNRGERSAKFSGGSTLSLPNTAWDSRLIDPAFKSAHTETLFLEDAAGMSDGRILLLGSFSTFAGYPIKNLIRLRADGSVDTGFQPSSYFSFFYPDMVRVSPTDQIYIGAFNLGLTGSSAYRSIYRLTSSGGNDSSFACPAFLDSWVYAILFPPGGGLLCGGSFGSTDTGERKNLARLTETGAVDTRFDAGNSTDSWIYGMALEGPDRLWVGGSFGNVQGVARDGVALMRLSSGVAPTGQVVPKSVTIPDGRPVTFGLSGTATGETYVWLRDGVPIPGANGPTLAVTSAVPISTKTYTARVTNNSGTTVSSGTLTVREALLAEWLADRGLNGLLADHDSDGDGMANSAEYLARTDPLAGSSVFGTRAVPGAGFYPTVLAHLSRKDLSGLSFRSSRQMDACRCRHRGRRLGEILRSSDFKHECTGPSCEWASPNLEAVGTATGARSAGANRENGLQTVSPRRSIGTIAQPSSSGSRPRPLRAAGRRRPG